MARQTPDTRSVYKQLRSLGFEPAEAGNVTAYLSGLEPVAGGWSIVEVERLLFVRYLVDVGALRP